MARFGSKIDPALGAPPSSARRLSSLEAEVHSDLWGPGKSGGALRSAGRKLTLPAIQSTDAKPSRDGVRKQTAPPPANLEGVRTPRSKKSSDNCHSDPTHARRASRTRTLPCVGAPALSARGASKSWSHEAAGALSARGASKLWGNEASPALMARGSSRSGGHERRERRRSTLPTSWCALEKSADDVSERISERITAPGDSLVFDDEDEAPVRDFGDVPPEVERWLVENNRLEPLEVADQWLPPVVDDFFASLVKLPSV